MIRRLPALILCLIGSTMAASADAIYLQTASDVLPSNDPPATSGASDFNVYVGVSGINFNMVGFEFDLSYNPAQVNALSVTEGSYLAYGANTTFFYSGIISNTYGAVSSVQDITTGGDSLASAGNLATVQFENLVPSGGSATITLSNFELIDALGNFFTPQNVGSSVTFKSDLVPLTSVINNNPPAFSNTPPGLGSTGPASPVPEPRYMLPTFALLLVGLSIAGLRQRVNPAMLNSTVKELLAKQAAARLKATQDPRSGQDSKKSALYI